MESWIYGTKIVLVTYLVLRWSADGITGGGAAVLLILAYVCAMTLYHVLRPLRAKHAALVLSIAIPAAAAIWFEPWFAVLLPVGAAELVVALGYELRYTFAPSLVPLLFLGARYRAEYLLAAALALIAHALAVRMHGRLNALQKESDELRSALERQEQRALAGVEYEEQLTRVAQLEERNRLAREVHDRLGHSVAGSVVQLEAASALLGTGGEVDRANGMIRNSIEVLRGGMESIRSTLHGLKPEREELGIQRLRATVDQFAASSGISVQLAHAGDLGLVSSAQWTLVTDNTREALTNVMKHSEATRVRISVEVMAKLVKAEISDNGKGAVAFRKGLGIRGIEERTGDAGGSVIVDGSNGFSIIMLLPMEGAKRAD